MKLRHTFGPMLLLALVGFSGLMSYGQDSSAKALFDSGNKQLKERNFADAIAYFTGAISADEQFAKAYTRRGVAKRNKGDSAGALTDLSRAIELDPKDGEAYYNRGLVAAARRELTKGLEDLNRAVELEPKSTDVFYGRGLIKSMGSDTAGAIADYGKAIELDANNMTAYQARGKASLSINEFDNAIADFTRVIQVTRDTDTYFERGAARVAKGDQDGAISDFGQIISADPNDPRARFRRGVAKSDKRDFKGALTDLQKAMELGWSDDVQLRIWLVRSRLGERQPATKDLLAYIDKKQSSVTASQTVQIAKFLAGKTTEEELLKAASASDSDSAREFQCQVYFYAGQVRLLEKDNSGATERFEKSVGTGKSRIAEYASSAAELKTLTAKK